MGGQYSHLVFQPCEQPSYDDKLEGLEWIDASSTPIELEREANSTPNSTPGSPTETRAHNNNNNDNNETTITISSKLVFGSKCTRNSFVTHITNSYVG